MSYFLFSPICTIANCLIFPQIAISYLLALSEKENFVFIGYLNIFTTGLYSKEEHFLQERK